MTNAIRGTAMAIAMLAAGTAGAQTHSARETATAYGARLTARGQPANLNENRVNNRIDNRLNNRLSLRIERYRPDSTSNPTAAYETAADDRTRTAPVLTSPQQQQQQQYDDPQ